MNLNFLDYFFTFSRQISRYPILKNLIHTKVDTIALYLLIFSFLISIVSHVIFSVGINDDGVDILFEIFLNEGNFFYIETSRKTFHFLYQLPFILYLKIFPTSPLSLSTIIWSFSLIWIHILSILGCYFILPKSKKFFIFFPLLAFATGPLIALSLSISVSLVVFSYTWFVAFIIYYSNLSIKIHKILFLTAPLPLLFSHELMSFMAWPLIYLCLLKMKPINVKPRNKILIIFVIKILFLISLISTVLLIYPFSIDHRNDFIFDLLNLKFFINNKGIDPACILAFLTLIFPVCELLNSKYLKKFIIIIVVLISIITIITPFYNSFKYIILNFGTENEARVWVVCIALPLSFFLWWLFEKNKLKITKSFLLVCIFTTISLIIWRTTSDYRFYQYQVQFSEKISKCKGLISWNDVKNKSFQPHFLNNFYRWYSISQASIFYPRSYSIKALIKTELNSTCIDLCDTFLKLHLFDTNDLMSSKSGCF